MIDISDVFFPQLSNGIDSFPQKFHFHLQKIQNVLYLKKCIFNIFFYPLDRKLSIFYVGKDIFQRVCGGRTTTRVSGAAAIEKKEASADTAPSVLEGIRFAPNYRLQRQSSRPFRLHLWGRERGEASQSFRAARACNAIGRTPLQSSVAQSLISARQFYRAREACPSAILSFIPVTQG